MEDEAERKRSFFAELYAYDSKPDDSESNQSQPADSQPNEENEGDFESFPAASSSSSSRSSSPKVTIHAIRTPALSTTVPGLLRSVSAPASSSEISSIVKETPVALPRLKIGQKSTPLAKEISFVEETPLMARSAESMRMLYSPTEVKKPVRSRANSKTLGKRKRDSLVMVPENRRIFNGLMFFYLPNDDIAPARKARIKKAQEYGALRTTVYDENVTHLIVDKSLTYEDVAKYLKLSSSPKAILVNEDYPVDCIQSGFLRDHEQIPYMIPGYQRAVEKTLEKSHPQLNASEDSGELLRLKRPVSKLQAFSFPPNTPSPSLKPSLPEGNPVSAVKRIDILDEIIQETKKLEHFLPGLDDEEALSAEISQEPNDVEDGYVSPEENPKALYKKKRLANIPWQEGFSCMTGGTGQSTPENPNVRTIDILQEMTNYYDRMNDTWRVRAYRMAITSLKRQTTKVTTYDEAICLPFVGDRLAEKIEEIVRTSRLRRLDNTKLEPTDDILQKFMNIYGVANSYASKWVAQGYRTFSDLLEKANLTENQKLGIERYDDFLTRIPREEVTALGEIIKETARGIDPEVEIIIGGSYRRGAKDSGDIDILIVKKGVDVVGLHPFLIELVSTLEKRSFLVAALAVPRLESGSKWHGCCVLPGSKNPIWRRIDFLLVAECELGAALIYFTGNDIFNRSIRLLASRKHMRLNQRGLYKDVMRGPGRVKLNDGVLVEGRDERKIFEILGVPWRKPEDRIC